MQEKNKILIAEDHGATRRILNRIIKKTVKFPVISEAVDGLEAVAKAGKFRPDLIIMDVQMPGLGGIEATRRITCDLPGTKIVVFSIHGKEEVIDEAIRAGACNYVVKTAPVEELIGAIETALVRDIHFVESLAGK